MLDMVAMEMAAPDPDEEHDFPVWPTASPRTSRRRRSSSPCPRSPRVAGAGSLKLASRNWPRSSSRTGAAAGIFGLAVRRARAGPSLGSTLIARGILQKPNIPANDPLAPIRRMSQAEKIAFFS